MGVDVSGRGYGRMPQKLLGQFQITRHGVNLSLKEVEQAIKTKAAEGQMKSCKKSRAATWPLCSSVAT